MTRQLEDTLGLNPLPIVIDDEYNDGIQDELNADVSQDIITAKEHIINARDIAQKAVQDMLEIASSSQDPKAYKALNDILKTYADISMSTVDLQTKKQALIKKEETKQTTETNVVNQNLFVGSTAEMLALLDKMKKDV